MKNFTNEELEEANAKLANKKAAGSDGITNEILKITIKTRPKVVLRVMNKLLKERTVPDIWKTSTLVLIPKPKKTLDTEIKFRPICLNFSKG